MKRGAYDAQARLVTSPEMERRCGRSIFGIAAPPQASVLLLTVGAAIVETAEMMARAMRALKDRMMITMTRVG
jgi:hypothetical protein